MDPERDTKRTPLTRKYAGQRSRPHDRDRIYVVLSIGLYFVLAPAISNQEVLTSHLQAAGIWGVLTTYCSTSATVRAVAARRAAGYHRRGNLRFLGNRAAVQRFGFWQRADHLPRGPARRAGKIVERFPGGLRLPWRLIRSSAANRGPWSLLHAHWRRGLLRGRGGPDPGGLYHPVAGGDAHPSVAVGSALGAGIISNALQNRLNTFITIATFGTIATLLNSFAIARKYLPGWLERLESASNSGPSADQ